MQHPSAPVLQQMAHYLSFIDYTGSQNSAAKEMYIMDDMWRAQARVFCTFSWLQAMQSPEMVHLADLHSAAAGQS